MRLDCDAHICTIARHQPHKFQSETIAIAITHRRGDPKAMGSLKLHFHQITWLQRHASIERHSALADLGGQPGHNNFRSVVGSNDADRQLHLVSRPTSSVWGSHRYFSRCTWKR